MTRAKTVEQQGPKAVKYAQVSQAVCEALEARSERTLITADRVLTELGRSASPTWLIT